MMLTPEQEQILEMNMGLVAKVIKDKVHGLGRPGMPEYDDLFQIGCIGLCKAIVTDNGSCCFSTYAYRLIWNAILDELARCTRLIQKSSELESIDAVVDAGACAHDSLRNIDLRQMLQQAKANASESIARGITCLELTVDGYNSTELAQMFNAEAKKVRMWMTRARRYLQSIPELREYMSPEAA